MPSACLSVESVSFSYAACFMGGGLSQCMFFCPLWDGCDGSSIPVYVASIAVLSVVVYALRVHHACTERAYTGH